MALVLNEEQSLLKSTAEDFFGSKAPVSALRSLRDNNNVDGFSRELWREIVAMGWPGTCLPEEYGGIDCGFTELGVVLQASGRTLVASPLFSSIVLAATGILLGGTEAQKSTLLPAIASGDRDFYGSRNPRGQGSRYASRCLSCSARNSFSFFV